MKILKKQPSRTLYRVLLVGGLVSIVIAGTLFLQSRFNGLPQVASSIVEVNHKESFPEINVANLDSRQQKIVTLLGQEYKAQNKGTKYSGGVEEPWCADFVSWIMNEAGVPLRNPNSGSWRIPGTYTLREYYQAEGKFKPGDSGYQPKIGDVMLYDNPSPFGQHTNIVLKNDHGVVTTVGGNEPGGIRVYTHHQPDGAGFVGYGTL